MPAIIKVVDGRTIIKMGENTALASKYANEAELSAETAAMAAAAVGVFQSVAEGEAATVDGQSFYVASGGEVTLYRNVGGTGVEVATLATDAAIAAVEAEINVLSSTVDDVVVDLTSTQSDLATLGTVTGIGGNAPNVTQFPDHNFLNSGASASAVMAGTVDQPNVVGGLGHIQTFQGDGSTAAFPISPGFIVENAAYRNILVYLVTRQTGAEVLQNEGFQYSVSGKGTSNITLTMNTPPTADQDIRVRIYRKENSAFSPLLNFSGFGYDNFNDGSGSMVIQFGAHHVNINNAGGHNTFAGGAGHTIRDGAAYAFASGLSQDISAGNAACAVGMRGKLTGTAPFHAGASGRVGAWSAHFGELGEVENPFSVHFGRRGKSRIAGSFVMGSGVAADPLSGAMGYHEYPMRRVLTTNSPAATLIPITGSATFVLDDFSVATVEAEILMFDIDTKEFRHIKLRTTVMRGDGAATTTLTGSRLVTADQLEEIDKSGSLTPAIGQWDGQIVASTGGGGVNIIARGEPGRIIQAQVKVSITFVSSVAAQI